jgi:hypothetical protein
MLPTVRASRKGGLRRTITSAEISKRFIDQGFVVQPAGPLKLDALMRSEIERWGVVVRRSGARVQ